MSATPSKNRPGQSMSSASSGEKETKKERAARKEREKALPKDERHALKRERKLLKQDRAEADRLRKEREEGERVEAERQQIRTQMAAPSPLKATRAEMEAATKLSKEPFTFAAPPVPVLSTPGSPSKSQASSTAPRYPLRRLAGMEGEFHQRSVSENDLTHTPHCSSMVWCHLLQFGRCDG